MAGDSLVEVLVEGLQERSRLKMTEDLRSFSMVDNHEAVKIVGLQRTLESVLMMEPYASKR